ncbi:hypothetical protein DPMN_149953 [Dreissena polymorpha]|uniref:Uncharacterized protein n=1 Tax=Dreissena polymorpha TaxID=45954 RepID=A0A9D4J2W8_DREPO|nr:hypothetical protein DPMN_149953 [Dreissena polymorpha]
MSRSEEPTDRSLIYDNQMARIYINVLEESTSFRKLVPSQSGRQQQTLCKDSVR